MLVAPWANRKWLLSLLRSLRIIQGGRRDKVKDNETRCGQSLHGIWEESQRTLALLPLADVVIAILWSDWFLTMNILRTRLTTFLFPRQSKLSPSQLDELQKATHFDKKELQQWYKGGWNLG